MAKATNGMNGNAAPPLRLAEHPKLKALYAQRDTLAEQERARKAAALAARETYGQKRRTREEAELREVLGAVTRDVVDAAKRDELAALAGVQIPSETSNTIWRLLPSTRDARILNALTFYRTSLQRVWFSPGDLYDLARWEEEGTAPASAVDHATYDSAFQDAYKAIEAMIGDPNENDARFHQNCGTRAWTRRCRRVSRKEPLVDRIPSYRNQG